MKTVPLHTHLYLTCTSLLLSSFSRVQAWSTCDIQAQFLVNRYDRAGDLVLGGLFPIHVVPDYPELNFTTKLLEPICYGFDVLGFRQSQVMAFAIAEINRDPALLPNMTLGYRLSDTCCIVVGVGFKAAVSLVSGREERVRLDESCAAGSSPPVLAVVGPETSTQSIAMSSVLGLYQVPLVSYFATCACLSDRRRFPSFFRTIPSDAFQVRAMQQLMKRFGWTWVGLVVSDDAYGRNAARSLKLDLERSGEACLAYVEVLPSDGDLAELRRIVSVMKTSTARVVAVFELGAHMKKLMNEVMRQNLTGLQWMASVSWATYPGFRTPKFMPYLTCTLGVAIRRGKIPGLRDFLLSLRPDDDDPDNGREDNLLRQFWEHTFACRFAPVPSGWLDEGEGGGGGGRVCSGREDLGAAATAFLDTSDLRKEYNVYKAVYALAHALHDLLQCAPGAGPFLPGHRCATPTSIQPWQLVHYLEKVSFTTPAGDHVSFDENGDPLPIYDVMNWAWLPDGGVELRNVGVVRTSTSGDEELVLDEDAIFWGFESNQPPRSVCSESCSPGTRVARRKGEPVCCFDCIACSDGQVSNETDSPECAGCPEDFWSNVRRDRCVPKATEYLSYHEALGISLTAASLLGALLCAAVLAVFVYHRDTPMVRANNSELSFQLLLSLKLCFLCSLLFIGHPRLWTCQLRHAAFGISFVLCVSCILVKTMVVLAVFKASKPGGASIMKWFGAAQQRATVLALTSVQAIICAAWLATASPTPHKNTRYHSDRIVYECAVGSPAGFAVLLGYIGVLALLSFALAFAARNLPDNFNEARLITFSMLIFVAVWVAFVPAYVSSPGKYADVVEVFAILASSFGLLVALFAPKCYVMLLRPERNTKKSIMGRGGGAGAGKT